MGDYYKPNLEEFHHGCKFYIRIRDMESYVHRPIVADIWATGVLSPRNAINTQGEDNVLMKMLDQADIEELGWKFEKSKGLYKVFEHDDFELHWFLTVAKFLLSILTTLPTKVNGFHYL